MVSANNSINNKVGASVSGVTNTLTVTNPSNTASSAARTTITVGGGTAADPTLNFNISGTTDWEMGIDNSASDSLKIAHSAALGTNDAWIMTTGGQRTMPLQSAFFAYVNADQNNVTGDATAYIVQFQATESNVNSNFNTGTGVYTAPVTGKYMFFCSLTLGGFTSAHTTGKVIFERNGTQVAASFRGNYFGIADAGDNMGVPISTILALTAGDTVRVQLAVSGGTKVVDVLSSGGVISSFSGALLY